MSGQVQAGCQGGCHVGGELLWGRGAAHGQRSRADRHRSEPAPPAVPGSVPSPFPTSANVAPLM